LGLLGDSIRVTHLEAAKKGRRKGRESHTGPDTRKNAEDACAERLQAGFMVFRPLSGRNAHQLASAGVEL
jgi:hypothetical protein